MAKRVTKAAPRSSRTVNQRSAALKGNGLPRRTAASPQAAPVVDPTPARQGIDPRVNGPRDPRVNPTPGQDAYGRQQKAPLPAAYGPPVPEFGGDLPRPTGAVAQTATAQDSLAPRPIVDKFPIIIGAGLSFAYLSACQRTALTGYRMQYVDLLREIIERDPHLFAVVTKTILGVANGRLEIEPAELPEGHPDADRAKDIALDVERRIRRIRTLKQSLYALAWGGYYGVTAAELHYERDREGGWIVDRLGFIHSRRLSYPDMGTWDLYIWDQGQVLSASPYGTSPTNSGIFGLRVADFPQKFIVYAPQMSGDYPTREGIGRIVSEWALSKRLNSRVALRYLERFVTPWPEGRYNTADPDDEKPGPRIATDREIALTEQAISALGTGALSSWVHSDAVSIELQTPDKGRAKLTFKEFQEMCNDEMSKGAIGGTLTTSAHGQGLGGKGLGQTHKEEEKNVVAFYAAIMSDTLKEQLVTPLTLLNHRDADHLIPQCKLHVEDEDPKEVLQLAIDAAKMNIPVDADEVAINLGIAVVPKPDGVEYRRMLPLDVSLPADLEPTLMPLPQPGTAGFQKLENEKTKAAQPHVMPGAPVPTTTPDKTPTSPTATVAPAKEPQP